MVAHCDIQSPRPPNGSQPWVSYLVWPKLSISQDLLVETVHFFCMYFSPSSHGLRTIILCSILIIRHWYYLLAPKDNHDKRKIVKAYIKLYQLTVLVPFLLNLTYLLSKSLSITTWGPSALLTFGQPAKKLHCCKIVFLSVFGFCLFTWHSLETSTLLAWVAKKLHCC